MTIDDEQQTINPHDTRRTYADLIQDEGMPLLAIQQHLGHSDSPTRSLVPTRCISLKTWHWARGYDEP
ncbi:MAG: hypothetical protein ABI700_05610 [Chloroflexota bacterium]